MLAARLLTGIELAAHKARSARRGQGHPAAVSRAELIYEGVRRALYRMLDGDLRRACSAPLPNRLRVAADAVHLLERLLPGHTGAEHRAHADKRWDPAVRGDALRDAADRARLELQS
eukprot:gene6142-16619_t